VLNSGLAGGGPLKLNAEAADLADRAANATGPGPCGLEALPAIVRGRGEHAAFVPFLPDGGRPAPALAVPTGKYPWWAIWSMRKARADKQHHKQARATHNIVTDMNISRRFIEFFTASFTPVRCQEHREAGRLACLGSSGTSNLERLK
jgi:hypothetical protein